MKKITKAGVYLSLAAMLVLGTETVVSAHDDWEKDAETEENYYTDGQGIDYKYLDNTKAECYVIKKFTQSYDVNKKPLFTKIEILDQIDGIPVKSIGNAFAGHKEIREITMGNGVWKNSGSFKGCTGLKSIKLSSQITKISVQAFKGCKNLTSVSIPDNCTNIGKNAFNGCTSLKTIQFQTTPSKLKIGKNAFCNTPKLKTIVLPGNAKTAKQIINTLKNPQNVTLYVDQKRVKQLKKTLSCKVRAIQTKKVGRGNVIVSKSENGKIVEDDQGLVYQLEGKGCYITKFHQKYDVNGTPIYREIKIPQDIDSIRVLGVKNSNVFQYCKDITSVTVPDSVDLPKATFLGCTNLKKVVFVAGEGMPEEFRPALKDNLFRNCSNLEEVVFSEKMYSIGSYAFMNCVGLKKLTFPKKLCYIKEGAFYNTGLEMIQSDNEYMSVGRKSFANCKNLKSVDILQLDNVGSYAFYNCTNLEKVTLKKIDSNCRMEGNAFENTKWIKPYQQKNKPVIVDGVLINGYYVKGNITLGGKKIKGIAGRSFANNQKIKKLKLSGIKNIAGSAFAETSVTEVSLSGCKILDTHLFSECRKLKKISVSGIKQIQSKTFAFIPGLKKIIFGKEVTSLEENTVYHCTNLRTVSFKTQKPLKWSSGAWGGKEGKMFVGCTKLRDVYMNSKSLLKGSENSWMDAFDKKKVTIHVPKKLYQKYEDSPYIYCKVVAKK